MFVNERQVAMLRRFLPYLRAQKVRVLTAYSFSFISILLALAVPWPLKFLIDGVLLQQSGLPILDSLPIEAQVLVVAIAMFFLASLAAVVLAIDKISHVRVRENFAYTLRDDALQKIQRLSRSSQLAERSGELTMRLVSDVNQVSRLFCKTVPLAGKHIITALLTLGSVVLISWPLGFVAFVMAALLASLIWYFGRALSRAATRKRSLEGGLAALTQETINGIEHVQAMALEDQSRVKYLDCAARTLHAGVEEVRVALSLERSSQIVAGLAIALIAGVGGYLVVLGSMTLGTLTVCLSYVIQLLKPIEKINEIAGSMSRGFARGQTLQMLFEADGAEIASPGTTKPTMVRSIDCRNLAYRYPDNSMDTVSGFTHCFKQGQCTAIIGASGCGKSTLLRLLMRLQTPTEGDLLFDGVDYPDIDTYALRSHFAALLQKSHLFSGSIREILKELRPSASDSQLNDMLTEVGLLALVRSLPNGLDTTIDEAGNRVSGGQRARLLLARALLSERPVLFLDEPFANIDRESKRIVIQRLAIAKRDKILIIVTHEREILEIADCVLTAEEIFSKKVPARVGERARLEAALC